MPHTPGPWRKIGNNEVVGPPNSADLPGRQPSYEPDHSAQIIETDGGVYPPCNDDAALIAAAPELLEALKLVNQRYQIGQIQDDKTGFMAKVIYAIAKAEGRL